MASVSSLDQDMRNIRLSRYTPSAANEARTWIEGTLNEKLPPGDLLDALKDGTALCKLANLATGPPGVKFKKSPMPFVQMENISHFLRICENPPLNLPAHDRFLTVDLYESKDPAQVLQCLGAFSRVASSVNPSKFPTTLGPKRSGGTSPQRTGALSPTREGTNGGVGATNPTASRALSPTLTGGSNSSRTSASQPRSPTAGAPAWNINMYGYMGGASQGNQGIAFGGRRQITSAGPYVPSLAEKERKRREQELEDERLRLQEAEAEEKRRTEREAEEERLRAEEEERLRVEEQRRLLKQKKEWEEQERRWKEEEEARMREENNAAAGRSQRRSRANSKANEPSQLRGQYLSEYNVERKRSQQPQAHSRRSSRHEAEITPEQLRVRELERQLEEAKERERKYQLEREDRFSRDQRQPDQRRKGRSRSRSRPAKPPPREDSPKNSDVSWTGDEREYLRQQWTDHQPKPAVQSHARPLPDPTTDSAPPPALPTRPLPEPSKAAATPPAAVPSPRPLPDPSKYAASPAQPPPSTNRTSTYLSAHPAPLAPKPTTHTTPELTATNERAAEDARRQAAQTRTKAGGWASKSLLEREMERERERQREWEEAQAKTRQAPRDAGEGAGEGQTWGVNQYGWMGGDSQNRGSTGIGMGGRRQIIGPRPLGVYPHPSSNPLKRAIREAGEKLQETLDNIERDCRTWANDAQAFLDEKSAELDNFVDQQKMALSGLELELSGLVNGSKADTVRWAREKAEALKNDDTMLVTARKTLEGFDSLQRGAFDGLEELMKKAVGNLVDVREVTLNGIITADPKKQAAFVVVIKGCLGGKKEFVFELEWIPWRPDADEMDLFDRLREMVLDFLGGGKPGLKKLPA